MSDQESIPILLKDFEELYRININNAAGDLIQNLQNMRRTFHIFVGDGVNLLDKYIAFDRQLALLLSETRRLQSMETRINDDFRAEYNKCFGHT